MSWVEAEDELAKSYHTPRSPDRHVEAVRSMLLIRSQVGLAKYGVTTERTDIDLLGWLNHLQEELCDAAVYLERIKEEVNADLAQKEGDCSSAP